MRFPLRRTSLPDLPETGQALALGLFGDLHDLELVLIDVPVDAVVYESPKLLSGNGIKLDRGADELLRSRILCLGRSSG